MDTLPQERNRDFISSLKWPGLFILFLWVLHIVQWLLSTKWAFLGVYPRKFFGLPGILTSPLIHGDFSHLFNNSVPFLVLGTMTLYFYRRVAVRSFVLIYILTGLVVWVVARERFHIGLSGVVFGLLGFVLGSGIFRRNLKAIVLSLVVLFFYSGMLAGLFPTEEGISWESHLGGFIVGLFAAFYYKEEIEADEIRESPWEEEIEDSERPYFLPRDIFDKTKAERQREAEERGGDWFQTNTWD